MYTKNFFQAESDDNVMIVETETVPSDVAKKRKIEIPDVIASPKKRKLEIDDTGDVITIVENDVNSDGATDKAKSKSKRTVSEDDDCLIVHDDNMQSSAVAQ